MTTIAWDGETLAADRLSCRANLKQRTRKIFDCGKLFYGCAGAFDDVLAIVEWLRAGAVFADRPTLDGGGCSGIVVEKGTRRVFVVEGKRPVLVKQRAFMVADGSGRDFAMSAMILGKSAAEAVVFASKYDVYSGLGVDVVHIPLWVSR